MNRLLPTLMLLALTALMANTSVSLAQKENTDTCEGPIYNPKEVTKKADASSTFVSFDAKAIEPNRGGIRSANERINRKSTFENPFIHS